MPAAALSVGILAFAVVVLLFLVHSAGWSAVVPPEPFGDNDGGDLRLTGPTRCFSCRTPVPAQSSWLGRPKACFNCGRQVAGEDSTRQHGSCERPTPVRTVHGGGGGGNGDVTDERPPQTVLHRSTAMLPFRSVPAATCMHAGSGQCLL
jgi:hypothetical protein